MSKYKLCCLFYYCLNPSRNTPKAADTHFFDVERLSEWVSYGFGTISF